MKWTIEDLRRMERLGLAFRIPRSMRHAFHVPGNGCFYCDFKDVCLWFAIKEWWKR